MKEPNEVERIEELLIARATTGLDAASAAELDRLLEAHPVEDVDGFERAAAALELALVAESAEALEPLPAGLTDSLVDDAPNWIGRTAPHQADSARVEPAQAESERPAGGLRLVTYAGWFAAAAAAAVLIWIDGSARAEQARLRSEVARLAQRSDDAVSDLREANLELDGIRARASSLDEALEQARSEQSELESRVQSTADEADEVRRQLAEVRAAREQREAQLEDQVAALEELIYQPPPEIRLDRMLARADDVVRVPWSTTEDDLVAGTGATGEVIWSDSLQEGYMVFEAMQPNAGLEQQFQLWIFSATQSAETPVDGGVFDIGATAQRIVVPIDAKLAVEDPSLFAVTLERPGGVVVSSRERLLLTAQV
ncbi:MAG: anti-sigma factor [Planctomycetota bacterium]|jgi:hypothetical protein